MRVRLTWVSGLVIFLALGGPPAAAAQGAGGQVVKLGEGVTLTISGFLNATWFVDNGFFDQIKMIYPTEFIPVTKETPVDSALQLHYITTASGRSELVNIVVRSFPCSLRFCALTRRCRQATPQHAGYAPIACRATCSVQSAQWMAN